MHVHFQVCAVNKTEGCHLSHSKCKVRNSNINNNAIKRFIDMYKILECNSLMKIHVICIYNHVDYTVNSHYSKPLGCGHLAIKATFYWHGMNFQCFM